MGPGPDIPPPNPAAIGYVQSWGATVGNLGVANIVPPFFFSSDALFHANGSEQAVFGELTIGLLDRLDLTFGFRFTGDDEGAVTRYVPIDAPRPIEPGTTPDGDSRATDAVVFHEEFPDFGTVSTPRISIAYEPTDQIYLYASYAEGFTQGEIANNPNLPEPIPLDPEVVKTREIGLRSDWLGSRLRLNATYFDSRWDGLRVVKLVEIENPNNTGTFVAIPAPSSDGVAASSGFELEIDYLPGERWELDFAVGLLDTEYLDIGDPPPNGSGLQPGIPFAYAPELSYSLGVRYRWPMAGGGELLLAGDYGWMDEYQRASANQFQNKNPDGSDKPEPSYGLLNARIVYESAAANWRLSVFGTNLTDEWYVNGGFNTGVDWGYDIATIGRPREIGLGLDFVFDSNDELQT
jgi:iron complex outermembrane receptor protein